MTTPNFSVVIIGKNEAKTIPNLFTSMKDFLDAGGDCVYMDTGSTDKTVEIAKSYGVNVQEVGERFITYIDKNTASKMNKKYIVDGEEAFFSAGEKVFNFGSARALAGTFAKNDMCLSIDCSDIFVNFDYKFLMDIISENKKIKFNYNMINGDGLNAVKVQISRFYNRKRFAWKSQVHECLYGDFHVNEAMTLPDDVLMTRHIKQAKSRPYATGMALDIKARTHLSRSVYYLGRELFYFSRWKSAIKLLKQLDDIKDVWKIEHSNAYCIMAECYEKIGDLDNCTHYYNKAYELYPLRRAPLINLGYLHDKLGMSETNLELKNYHYRKALGYASASLTIEEGLSPYEENSVNYTYRPHEIIYRAYSNLGKKDLGRPHYQKALELSGQAPWILLHGDYFKN
jgi:glycosyltransferase involved in cell wall biosynthesis